MTTLPKSFTWLALEGAPKVLVEGLKLFGTREIVGPQHSPQIMHWAQKLGMARAYTMDETPWCGLYAAVVVFNAGYKPVAGALRALNWATWGVKADRASLGDLLVFKRPGGGHVGFYCGEDAGTYFCLGGNQGNAVSIVRIDKARCVAVRRSPFQVGQPANVRPVMLSAGGAPLSTNEA